MIPIPAIDLLDGRCVRLTEGVFDTAKTYSLNPEDIARQFAAEGAPRLHVVDLDAARGSGNNRKALAAIRKAFPGTIDTGGGIRSLDDALQLRDIGMDYLVLGTVLVRHPREAEKWAASLGRIFIAGIDARNGEVRVDGWEGGSSMLAVNLAARAREMGMAEIIYTDIARDGTLSGPNMEETLKVAAASSLPVVISGGIGSMEHLRQLALHPPAGISGVITGKALYEGRISLAGALKLFGIADSLGDSPGDSAPHSETPARSSRSPAGPSRAPAQHTQSAGPSGTPAESTAKKE